MAKNNYFDDVQPKENKKKDKSDDKKERHPFKAFSIVVGVLVIILACAWGVLKYAFPNFYFSTIIPDKSVAKVLDETILGHTTTTTEIATEITTAKVESVTYLDSEEFDFYSDQKGGFVGNIQNGGLVCGANGYIYHIYNGKGIYRLATSGESYACVLSTDHDICSLNVFGDWMYFVDNYDHSLTKSKANTNGQETVAQNISLAYIYNEIAYCVTTDNKIVVVDINDGATTLLYGTNDDSKLSFVGISLDRVFFTQTNANNTVEYLTVSKAGGNVATFREPTSNDSIKYMTMENGYMYYCQKQTNGSYDLIRQKFGSQKTVTLQSDVGIIAPVVVDSNKVFYSELNGSKLSFVEYNMNSNEYKTMLYNNYCSGNARIIGYHGGEYDFLIGTDKDGDSVYHGSSNLTSSTNVMFFNGGSWSY